MENKRRIARRLADSLKESAPITSQAFYNKYDALTKGIKNLKKGSNNNNDKK